MQRLKRHGQRCLGLVSAGAKLVDSGIPRRIKKWLSKAAVGTSKHCVSAGTMYGPSLIRHWPVGPWGRPPPAGTYSSLHWFTPARSGRYYLMDRRRTASSCCAGAARVRFRVLEVNDPAGEDHCLALEVGSLACGFGVLCSGHGQALLVMFAGLASYRLALERVPPPQRHWHSRQRTTSGGLRRGCLHACD